VPVPGFWQSYDGADAAGDVPLSPTGPPGSTSTALTGRWSLPRARPALPEQALEAAVPVGGIEVAHDDGWQGACRGLADPRRS
jgi:hypothetical protein